MGTKSRILPSLVLALCLLVLPQGVQATSATWDGSKHGTVYAEKQNWIGNPPSAPGGRAGETATFPEGAGVTSYTVNINASPPNPLLNFNFTNTTANPYTINVNTGATLSFTGAGSGVITATAGLAMFVTSGTGAITFGALSTPGLAGYSNNGTGSINFSAITSGAITASFIAGTGSGTFNLGSNVLTLGADTGNRTVAGTITGLAASGITYNNTSSGSLTLSGNSAATYAGTTTLTAGTLAAGNDSALGTGTLILNGGTLQASGTRTLANAVTVGGNFAIGGGASDNLTLNGNVNLGTVARTITVDSTGSTTLAGVISNTGLLTKAGAGTLTLSGANTYSGGTTVSAGTLQAGGSNSLGITGTVTINAGGTIDLSGNDQTFATLTGAGNLSNIGSLTVNAGTPFSGVISGTGSLTKATAGSLTLSGANTYTNTTLTAGTLIAGNDSAFGTGTLTLNGGTLQASGTRSLSNAVTVGANFTIGGGATDNLTLGGTVDLRGATRTITVNSTGSTTLMGVISNGSLTKAGTGSLIMSGTNTFTNTTLTSGTLADGNDSAFGTGTLTINGGTLQASGAARTVTNNITVGANFAIDGTNDLTLSGTVGLGAATRTLTVSNTADTTLSGVISNGGLNINNTGGGTVTLSGANTYTGTTTLTAGAVVAGTDTAIGGGSGALSMGGGTLQAGGAGARTLANAVTLTAGSTITGVAANDLTLSNTIGLGASILTVNGAGNVTLSNAISGTGGLTMAGTGTLALDGTSTYTGATTVTSGTLNVTGSLIGSITNSNIMTLNGTLVGNLINNGGATLNGTGTVIGALTNHGNFNPGNSPGTFNVVGGPFTNAPGSTLTMEVVSPSSYDKVAVTGAPGTAIITGSTLAPRLLGGYIPTINQVFPDIISTTGGVTGTFSEIANSRISRTLYWQPLYDANSVGLQAVANYTFADLNLSRNQLSVGNMLNGFTSVISGDMFTVLNAINALTTNQSVQGAYNEISPQKYAALPSLSFPVTNMQFQYLKNRLARLRWEAKLGRGNVSAGGGGFMRGFYFGYEDKMLLASNNFTVSDAGTPLIRKGMAQRWGIYLEPMANWGNLNATINQVGYRYKNFGFILGADYWIKDNFLVGLNTGYGHTDTGVGGTGGDINVNIIPVNAYSSFFVNGFYVNGTLGYTYNNFDLQRNIVFGTVNRTAKANTSGNQFQAAAETGYDITVGKAIVGPMVSLQYATLTTQAFTESNAGALNLKVPRQTADSLQTGVGARVSYQAKVGNVTVKPQLSVVWQHEYSDNTRGLNARLAQGSSTMNFRTDQLGRDFAVVGAEVSARFSKRFVAHVSYNAEVGRSNSSNQGVNAGLRFEF